MFKETLISSFLRTIVFVLVIISYAQIDSRISSQRAETIYGIIVTVLFFALIGAPLLEVVSVISIFNANCDSFNMSVFVWSFSFFFLDRREIQLCYFYFTYKIPSTQGSFEKYVT